ncbi:MAG: VWA domain-containing protein [Pseudomonadota bacterium]
MRPIFRRYQKRVLIFMACGVLSIFVGTAIAGIQPDKVVCRVETDRAILPAGDPQNVVIKVTLQAPSTPINIKRPKVNLALVLDQSGSMQGTKINQAKAAAIEAVSRLGKEDVFSVVVYDTNVNTIVPAQNAGNIEWIINRIRQIQTSGSTALFGGVSQGAAEIRKNLENNFVHRIVLLSDGLANVGPRAPEDLGRLGAGLIKENISVTTVGVGTDYNEDLMAQLAQKSDGNTYFVESGHDLPRIFSAELGDVLNVVAKQVKVIITLPDNVEPVTIIGREGRIKGQQIELYMNQLYGAQEKYALVEVRVPKSIAGSKVKVASADVVYENPFSQKQERSNGVSYASFSKDAKKVAGSTNIGVVREYQLNLNALAKEKAIELSDQGKEKEAVIELKQSAQKLKKYGSLYNDEQLLKQAEKLETQADSIKDMGMNKKSRKVLRTESYQMKNQQLSK